VGWKALNEGLAKLDNMIEGVKLLINEM
jgi:hypothetical protein